LKAVEVIKKAIKEGKITEEKISSFYNRIKQLKEKYDM